jgi:hypothetical protein
MKLRWAANAASQMLETEGKRSNLQSLRPTWQMFEVLTRPELLT